MARKNYFSLMNKIKKDANPQEDYGTGLAFEHIIVSSYKQMNIDKLEKMRLIINKIIKEKKEYKRVEKNKSNNVNNNSD